MVSLWEAMYDLDYHWGEAANKFNELFYQELGNSKNKNKDTSVLQLRRGAGWDPMTRLQKVIKWYYFDYYESHNN